MNRIVDPVLQPLTFCGFNRVVDFHAPGDCQLGDQQFHRFSIVTEGDLADRQPFFVQVWRAIVRRPLEVPGIDRPVVGFDR